MRLSKSLTQLLIIRRALSSGYGWSERSSGGLPEIGLITELGLHVRSVGFAEVPEPNVIYRRTTTREIQMKLLATSCTT